ncbi:MAG: PSD1 and planctomycete cytochrome C domain-containing protein [Bryobacteraceae bacterium]|nr:PSD1 and planctomycete cytochrome C domain-containing protein [Bryobacteraceae bacterium]
MRITLAWCAIALPLVGAPPPGEIEFFEKKVRPVLAGNCYSCHSTGIKVAFANLRLDSRAGAMAAIIPGKPGQSKLIRAVRGETGQRMPPSGALKPEQIADLARWVEMGAPWPDEAPKTAAAIESFDVASRRAAHWAWQPVRAVEPPAGKGQHPIDRFLLAALEAKGIKPSPPASRREWIRRITFDLTGLPPTPSEIAAFEADHTTGAYERLANRLIGSPRFGERFARRWMDLVRYSESHGSEGDPDTPEAWRYRDYLIRAFNSDVPYDQLIREHIAGDLVPQPRVNGKEQLNESVLGAAHLRMVEHGFQPVDPWEDRVKWADNQIDVFSKAFQGLTISCARCHDHKFDAISQKDFYALFGVFAGARPTQVAIDTPESLNRNRDELQRLKPLIRQRLAAVWKQDASNLAAKLADLPERAPARDAPETALEVWQALRSREDFGQAWKEVAGYWNNELASRRKSNAELQTAWDLTKDYPAWLRHGAGAPAAASPAGEFSIEPATGRAIRAIYPAGVYSHLLSRKHNAVIQSPRFQIDSEAISIRALGGDLSFAQLIIENYAVPRGGIYQMRYSPKKEQPGWATWDVTYWKGFTAYIEFATAQDATHFQLDPEDARKKPRPRLRADGRSHFGAMQVAFHANKQKPREELIPVTYLLDGAEPGSAHDLAAIIGRKLEEAVEAWRTGVMDDRQAAYLNSFLDSGLLSNTLETLAGSAGLIAQYRGLEQEVPVARRAPGVLEEAGPDARLLVRGNHKDLGEAVPRRYLTALASRPYDDPKLARLRLADEVAGRDNPLTARVMVNRIWQSFFRRGLVRTVDNFGKLGEAPSHPELLDYLARHFMDSGWSIKKMVRLIVTSDAYRMSSLASAEAVRADPGNTLVHHIPMRRLEAEEIRDAVLSLSGELDTKMYGRSVDVYYAHETGATKGDRPKGPLDGEGRRSVYLEIRRNAAHPFLEVFDAPKPATTRGERDVTNVPAQSLALLNSQFVIDQSAKWGRRIVASGGSRDDILRAVFEAALGRPPGATERDEAATYLASLQAEDQARTWAGFVHAILNLKEFLYVR